jgi:hypothetical protein
MDTPMPVLGFSTQSNTESYPFYYLGNKNSEGKEFTKIYKGKEDTPVDEILCSLVYYAPARKKTTKWKPGVKTEILCRSEDGLTPSKRIESPICHTATQQSIIDALVEAKLSKSKIQEIVESSFMEEKLCCCAYQEAPGSRVIPLCPASRWKEIEGENIPPSCDNIEYAFFRELESGIVFRVEMKGSNLRANTQYVAPWIQFQREINKRKRSFLEFALTLTGSAGPRGAAVWLPKDLAVIEDNEVVRENTESYQKVRAWHKRVQEIVPANKPVDDSDGVSVEELL